MGGIQVFAFKNAFLPPFQNFLKGNEESYAHHDDGNLNYTRFCVLILLFESCSLALQKIILLCSNFFAYSVGPLLF